MTERPAAMKSRCVAWEKKIETNGSHLRRAGGFILSPPYRYCWALQADQDMTSSQTYANDHVVCCFLEGFTTILKIIVKIFGRYK